MDSKILVHNQNWYRKVYHQIIDRARNRGLDRKKIEFYVEIHHIIPKCLGGNNDRTNLVALTYREHIICHKLLCKLYPNNYYLHSAVYLMLHVKIEGGKKIKTFSNTKEAEKYKLAMEVNKKPRPRKQRKPLTKEQRRKMSESRKGRIVSPETREKIKQASLGRKLSDNAKRKISDSLKGKHVGRKLTKEHKQKISEALVGRKGKSPTKEQIEKAVKTRISHGGWKMDKETKKKISDSLKKTNKLNNGHITNEAKESMKKRFGFPIEYIDSTGKVFKFDSISDAVRILKGQSILNKSFKYVKRCCELEINGFRYLKEDNIMIQRTIQGPNGEIYSSISDCARKLNINRSTILDWINNKPEKGYKIIQ